MQVINFLLNNNQDNKCWEKLTEAYGIKVKHYTENDLHVLNYDQIESPKMEPIVQECRGLILDYDLNVVCRPFDRFFNFGEADTQKWEGQQFDWAPKLDGSLIKVYMHQGKWHVATRGTAFAESNVGAWGITFAQLVYKAADVSSAEEFSELCRLSGMLPAATYLFELTAMENRVVTQYNEPKLTLLSARMNGTGEYIPYHRAYAQLPPFMARSVGFREGTPEEFQQKANALKNLEEGYVGYYNGVPVLKVKSEAYVAVHHIRGEGLNPKRICELVASGEAEEYLTYFPEDRAVVEPCVHGMNFILERMDNWFEKIKATESQKEFAINANVTEVPSLLFTARKNGTIPSLEFHRSPIERKVKILMANY